MLHVEAVAGHVLVFYHVEGCTEEVLLFEGANKVGRVHHRTARGVDEVEGVAETADEGVVDHVAGFFGQRHMEAQNLCALLQLFERDFLHIGGCKAGGFVFVVGYDVAFKALQPLRKSAAHVAEADDADGAAFEFETAVGFTLPKTLTDFGIGAGDIVE